MAGRKPRSKVALQIFERTRELNDALLAACRANIEVTLEVKIDAFENLRPTQIAIKRIAKRP